MLCVDWSIVVMSGSEKINLLSLRENNLHSKRRVYIKSHVNEFLASIQVSFRLLVCRLKTNIDFKFRVFMYHDFMVLKGILLRNFVCLMISGNKLRHGDSTIQLKEVQKRTFMEATYGP